MSTALSLSRRQALALAATGAVGAAGFRLFGFGPGIPALGSSAGGGIGWDSPLSNARALAAHLLRRAGFGYTTAELDAAASLSYSDLVDSLVSQKPQTMAAPSKPTSYTSVAEAWFGHMATTSAQYPERMALFWHGHLTSDYRKAFGLPYVYQQNVLFRQKGTGDLRSLLNATTADPLMMRYLDLDQSTSKAPNENYSRELMELYTLGVGNYTEADVREGARALSGMQIVINDKNGKLIPAPRRDKTANSQQNYYAAIDQLVAQGAVWKGVFSARRHDQGSKTYLGRTGNLGPTDVVDTILAQDACAPFIATKALTYFAVPNPPADLVSRVAADFRNSKYDITTLMRSIFNSNEFKDVANYRSLVRSPVDFSVAAMRALGHPEFAAQAVTAGSAMDQVLYDPPTVAGWPSNGSWLSSSSILARVNFAAQLVQKAPSTDPSEAVKTQLDSVVGPDLAAVYNASQSDADRWYAILASPEFHLK